MLSSSAFAQSGTVSVTYKRAIKLPPAINGVVHRPLNDSGVGATDLDTIVDSVTFKSRFIMANDRLWDMREKGDGTAYFGPQRVSTAALSPTAYFERHMDTSGDYAGRALFGVLGAGLRYNIVSVQGQPLIRWQTGLTSARSFSFGGNTTSIVTTASGSTRLYSTDRTTYATTPFHGETLGETGKSIGNNVSQAYGFDNNLYLWDFDNRRILSFDTGVNPGGTRGALLRTLDLDPTKKADNMMTVDPAGNFYIGDGAGGFNMYDRNGQWKVGFQRTYVPDPDANNGGFFPTYMNYYASGLNDGNGTLDVRDSTGYRQYNITAAGQTPPIVITSQPQSQTVTQSSPTHLSVVAVGDSLTYQWRKNGVELTDGGTLSGTNTPNLTISSTQLADAGSYDVLVRKPGAVTPSQPSTTQIVTSQTATLTVTPPALKISEFRLSGPGGATDEYIELANPTGSAVSLTGYTLTPSSAPTALSGLDLTGKTIPAFGHLLITNSGGYSLGATYPSTYPVNSTTPSAFASGDVQYTGDISVDSTLTLAFNGTTVDSVGNLSNTSGLNLTNQYAFVRRQDGAAMVDTDNDSNDFNLVDLSSTTGPTNSDGTSTLALGARLGAPGPQNSTSPVQLAALTLVPLSNSPVTPEGRYASKGTPLDTYGRLSLRRTITNTSNQTIKQIRFTLVRATSGTSSDASIADLRALTSSGVTYNGARVCYGIQIEAPTTPTIPGASLSSATTGNGAGLNSSWNVGTLPAGGLAPGQSLNVEFTFGILKEGNYNLAVVVTVLP